MQPSKYIKLMENKTLQIDFYITAFPTNWGQLFLLFVTFLLLYLIALIWNMVIVLVTFLDHHLQKPMYFFLCNLSSVDVLYVSVALPKLLDIINTGNNKVSFTACYTQMYFFTSLACTEICLLTTMSYDRYTAICRPLHYTLIMHKRMCHLLVAGCWVFGFSNSLFITIFTSRLTFCGSTKLNQFFCEIKTLTKLSCGAKNKFKAVILVEALFVGFCPFVLILMSYTKIISNILRMKSVGQRKKAFSTCTSHVTVLLFFYGTLLYMYMVPPSENSEQLDQIFSVFYLAVTPTMNPLIYSLRNKDINIAILNIFLKLKSCM
ncbi:PREDICTED: olfactory receptor 5B21-like [Nanorana parkeri]|uniref:olfactory receptor 5B21-like n=1 Tax=Nanorana parkeri TaxID=125878 RepID=UPI000854140F|nr:PREDICTED: olfactory receptor 5B21-like [Nanorana parkeri]